MGLLIVCSDEPRALNTRYDGWMTDLHANWCFMPCLVLREATYEEYVAQSDEHGGIDVRELERKPYHYEVSID